MAVILCSPVTDGMDPLTQTHHTYTSITQVLNVCLDVLAEMEAEARERAEEASAAAGNGGGGGGCGHVRGTGSGHLHGLEVRSKLVCVYVCVWVGV